MKHIFPTYMAQNMHPHSRSGEVRYSEEILDQNKTEKQPSRSMYSAWDFNFKGLGWLSPSSSVACDVNLSLRLVSLPQSALLGKSVRDLMFPTFQRLHGNPGFTCTVPRDCLWGPSCWDSHGTCYLAPVTGSGSLKQQKNL